jgi:predicted  nucleic acid-binding Zn-ribbon protein
MSLARALYQLQLVDTERDQNSQRLAEIESSLGETRDVVQAREAVVDIRESLGKLQAQMRTLELEIAGLSAKLKVNQDRLYGGKVRSPKELSSLQDEAAALGRRRSELEDEQLELMIAIDEQEAESAERQARFRQIEDTWRADQETLQADKVRREERLAELDAQRADMRTRIGPADLALYDDLRNRRGGTGVALLKRGICQVCGVDVPTGVAMAVQRGEGMHFCPVCNRLLTGG